MGTNKTIAKNTIFLYLRMFINLGISLFTSRVLLEALGIEDYGIYNLVGGIISAVSFISTTIISTNSRFLSFSIGEKYIDKVKKTFTTSYTSSIIIAIFIYILCQIVGGYWINNKINVDSTKLSLVNIIFQLSLVNVLLSIIASSFSSLIIAYQKLDFYALISLLMSLLNLFFTIFLKNNDLLMNNLILYSIFQLFVAFLNLVIYMSYCKKRFNIFLFKIKIDSKLIELFKYASWDLYGNLSVMMRTTGISLLQNLFFGIAINAAIAISNQIQGVINNFSSNILLASRSQIIIHYASKEYDKLFQLLERTTKYSTLLLCFIIVPLLFEVNFIIKLWLGIEPKYVETIVVWFLLFIIVANISQCVMIVIHATGNIKKSSFINGSLYLSVIPLSYFGFNLGLQPELPYVLNFLFVIVGGLLNMYYLKQMIPSFRMLYFLKKSIFPIFIISVLLSIGAYCIKKSLYNEWIQLLSVSSFCIISMSILSWFFVLDKDIKDLIKLKVKKRRK